jgi:uncharacterized protein
VSPLPADPGRIVTLDLIRGVAVMGILSVNIVEFAMVHAAYLNPTAFGGATGPDLIVWALNMLFVDGKMRALFSMLFGASLLLVVDRAEAQGESGWSIHKRRMLVLLAFGLAHFVFLWTGDILHAYAIAGLIAFAFRRASLRKLVGAGISFVALGAAIFGAFIGHMAQVQALAHASGAPRAAVEAWRAMSGELTADTATRLREEAAHLGTYGNGVLDRLGELPSLFIDTIVLLPETLGLMLLGMAAFRSGLFTGSWSLDRYRRVAAWGLGIGLAAHALTVWVDLRSDFDVPTIYAWFVVLMAPFRVIEALGIAALVILLGRSGGPLARRIAAVGRMAFSNYLGSSMLMVPIFAGWGAGLFDQLSRAQAWLLVPAVWAIMLGWSLPWLDRFRFGPLEWAWRSLARGKTQPMRRR